MAERLRPTRGGFLRPFGCGWFIREFLLGNGPEGASVIDPSEGAPQRDICYHYKMALLESKAFLRATEEEERRAKREDRGPRPEEIERLIPKYMERIAYRTNFCRYHSFVVYFTTLQRLGWVEFTGQEEHSMIQDSYPDAPPRRYYRLTPAGRAAPDYAWASPYGFERGLGGEVFATPPKPAPPAPKPAIKARKLLPAQSIADFDPTSDLVVRRGERTFIVDKKGMRADLEVQSDIITSEVKANLARLTAEQKVRMAEEIRRTPYLSFEGKTERLAEIPIPAAEAGVPEPAPPAPKPAPPASPPL